MHELKGTQSYCHSNTATPTFTSSGNDVCVCLTCACAGLCCAEEVHTLVPTWLAALQDCVASCCWAPHAGNNGSSVSTGAGNRLQARAAQRVKRLLRTFADLHRREVHNHMLNGV